MAIWHNQCVPTTWHKHKTQEVNAQSIQSQVSLAGKLCARKAWYIYMDHRCSSVTQGFVLLYLKSIFFNKNWIARNKLKWNSMDNTAPFKPLHIFFFFLTDSMTPTYYFVFFNYNFDFQIGIPVKKNVCWWYVVTHCIYRYTHTTQVFDHTWGTSGTVDDHWWPLHCIMTSLS